jgi:hypothetical protein
MALMADADALGENHTTFIQVEDLPALSRAGVRLHTSGIAVRFIRRDRRGRSL